MTIDSVSKALLKAGETSDLTWHADENGAFELRVGGADCTAGTVVASGTYSTQPATRISNVTAAQLAEGANTLRLCLTDAAGNRGQATTTLSKDTGDPDTTIGTKPAALVNTTAANFSFSGNDGSGSGIASFECRRDGGAWGVCTSPHEYTGLAAGAHDFEVKAIDKAGNIDATPATHNWQIDLTAPAVTIDSLSKALLNAGETSDVTWHADENGSFELRIGGADCTAGTVLASGTYTDQPATRVSNVAAAQLAEGANTLRLCLTDAAGNRGTATTTLSKDTVAPDTTIGTKPAALVNTTTTNFTFSGNDGSGSGIASFECRRDGGAWGVCTSPQEYTSLAEGAHTFEVKAIDQAGNVDATPATYGWTVDSTTPDTTIGTKPAALVNTTTANFTFSGNDGSGSGIASFECRRDGGTWAVCTSPHEYTGLLAGAHSFEVKAIDKAGNVDSTPATHSWTIDLIAPAVTIDSVSKALLKAGETSDLTWHADENGAFELRVGGADCTAGTVLASGNYTDQPVTRVSNVTAAQLAEGANTLRLCLTDAAGNRGSATTTLSRDTGLPDTTIGTKPAALVNTTTANFTFTGNDGAGSGIASFECRRDGGAWGVCTSPLQYTSLAEGAHDFEVKAIDQAGNVDGSPATHGWTVDTTSPAVQVDSGPSGLTNKHSPTFTFSSEPGASFECSIDEGAPSFGPCSGATSHTPASPLSDGLHTFRVKATDGATNQAIATRSFTVDTAAPSGPELSATIPASPANNNSPKVIGTAPAGTTIKLYTNADCTGTPIATGTVAELEGGITVSVADNTSTSFRATSTTAAENISACSDPIAYLEDSSAPDTTIGTKPSTPTNAATANFTFTGNDGAGSGIASFECRRDGGTWAVCTSPHEYTGLLAGAHSFEVKAIDKAGNVDSTPATHSWTIDLIAPAVTIDSVSKALLKAGETSDLTWHADENGAFELRVGGADCTAGTVLASGNYTDQPVTRVSNVTAAQLAEGANTLRLCLTDAAGNRGSATTTLSRDTGLPDTTIGTKPAALVNTTTANFTFTGNDGAGSGIASFECRRDGGAWGVCTSPLQYTSLAEGAHDFEVKAIDQAGNVDGSPATHGWTVDTTSPAVQVDSGPSGLTNKHSPTFTFSSEPGASFECSIDEGAPSFGPCSGATSHTPASPLSDGLHTFRVKATDGATNQAIATRSFTVDTAAPSGPELSATIPASPANNNSPKVIGTAPAGTTIKLYTNADCTGTPIATGTVAELEGGITVSVADNTSTSFRATSTTAAENISACSDPIAYLEDSSAPDTTIGTKPSTPTNAATANFTFTGNDGAGSGIASFECRRDGGAWGVCTSPHEYTGLAAGAHDFEVKAIDKAGNIDATPATHNWQIDLTAPAVTIDSLSKALLKAGETSDVTWHADENGAFELRVGGADCTAGTVLASGNYTDQPVTRVSNVTAAQLAEGANTLRLCLTDAAGNRGSATTTLSRDTGLPDTTIGTKPAALVNTTTANFTFSGNDGSGSGIASFECRRDGGAWGVCASPLQYTSLAEGAHDFEVKAIDQAGNADATPASFNWTVDTTSPDTTIGTKPAALVNTTTANFTFTGNDGAGSGIASFECRRDGGAWGVCTSPLQYTSLAEGAHDFEVKAIDQAGNVDGSPATHGWTVDTTSPAVQVDSGPSGLTNKHSPTFTFSSEPGASFECSIDEGAPSFGPCSGATSHTPASPLSDGLHTFRVKATDGATNQAIATRSFTVDTAAPSGPELSATIPASPANNNSPKVIGTAPAGTTIKLYTNADCTGTPIATGTVAELEGGITVSVADNTSTSFRATSTTAAENISACSDPIAYLEDSSAPDTTIGTKPSTPTNAATANFTFTGNDGAGSGIASFECRRDGGAWGVCTSPHEYTGLAAGAHDFEVKAIDKAGNIDATPATHNWQIDLTAPAVTIDSLSKALLKAGETSDVTWHADENGAFELRVGGADCTAGTVLASGNYTDQPVTRVSNVTAAQLAEGANTLRLCLTDAAGNRGSATTTLSRDTGLPDTTIGTKPAALVNTTTANFTFSGNDGSGSGIASFECRRDGGAWGVCASPLQYTSLAEGAHDFEVKAIDQAGNADTSPASYDWSVDSQAPETQIDTHPAAVSTSSGASFAFSAFDDGGSGVASYQCRRDAEDWTLCTSPRAYSALAEGAHSFEVRAIDVAGNVDQSPATFDWEIDSKAPEAQIDTKPTALANSATANFTFSASDTGGSGIASFECRIDGGAWSVCTSPHQYTGLAEGAHTFEVKAIDQAGNVDATPATFSWTIDSQAPTTTIETKPAALVNSGTASFTFSGADAGGSGLASFECRRDGGAWGVCTSPRDYTGLGDDSHSFEVKAVDQAGNADATPASFAWTVDTTAPAVQIDSGPSGLTNNSSPTFQFSSEPGAGFECSIDEGTPTFGPCSGTGTHTPASPLANGPHTFRVRATDAATNQATVTRSFTIDTTAVSAPELTATVPASPANDNTPEIVGTALTGTTVKIYANAGCTGTPLATGTAAELAGGIEATVVDNTSTSFRATATTAAGSLSPCSDSISYVEDSGAPDTEITLKPASSSSSSSAKFEFAGSDGSGSGIASFECRGGSGDPAGWASCASPMEYTGLGDGAHVFEVRATDVAGNTDASPASFAWAIDTTPAQEQPPTGSNPPTDPGTVNAPEFVRVLRNKKKGTALLVFKIPSPGLLSARAPEIGLRRPQGSARTAAEDQRRLRLLQRRIKPRRIRIVRPGQVKVPIELTPVGMKLLSESHRLKVDVVVRFKAADGSKATWKIAVTLEKQPDPEATEARRAKK